MEVELRDLKANVIHDFPYPSVKRKCPHVALVSITHSGCCVHKCPMCYARSYKWSVEDKIVCYKNVPEKLETEIKQSNLLPPFYISQVSDALQPVTEVREITFKVVRLLMQYKLSFHIVTKSAEGALALIETIPDLIDYPYWHIQMTIEASKDKQSITSPYASEIEQRFEAVKKISEYGIPVVGRTDPTILGLVKIEEVCGLIQRFASSGAKHIVGSLGFYNPLSMGRVVKSILDSRWRNCIPELEKVYSFKADYLSQYAVRKMFSPTISTRTKFHYVLRREAEKYGLTYGICLELPKQYDSPNIRACDGMLRNFVHIRVGNDFLPIDCCANCLHSCPDLTNPPCNRTYLQQEYPYKYKRLCAYF
ncbi:MAG: radical SAM protein [Candidatus Stahlbacteria bacterium]|nr:radical SAM protein [Candidatus Stahlbacteria bacterium]